MLIKHNSASKYDIVLDVAEKLARTCLTKKASLSSSDSDSSQLEQYSAFRESASLAGGYSGLLLLFSALQNREVSGGFWDRAVHQCVIKIKEIVESNGLSDLSLFSGVTGICFALELAAEKEGRYTQMLQTLQNFLLQRVRKNLIDPLCSNVKNNCPSFSKLYDPIQGVSGIGRYALKNLSLPLFHSLAVDIAKALVLFCLPLIIDGKEVPGWYLPANDLLNKKHLADGQKGNFNLGLAHGITGVLAYLSIAALNGVIVDKQLDTMRFIAGWLREKGDMQWPSSISWQEEVKELVTPKKPSRDAWCYGVPGIARTLFLTGQALGDENLKDFAFASFQKIFTRPRVEWQIPGPGLCHGIAGLLSITDAMVKESRSQGLHDQVVQLEALLLSQYNESWPLGFRDTEIDSDGNAILVDKAGWLEGSAGVALTLLTSSESPSTWNLPLLIYA